MNRVGDIVTGVYGLGTEDIIYPHPSIMYTGLIVDKINEGNETEYYELYCEDGKLRKFRPCEIINVIIHREKDYERSSDE